MQYNIYIGMESAIGKLTKLILNRDINPNNLLIQNFKESSIFLTLIDFNVSKKFREKDQSKKLLMKSNTGTQCFVAPEVHDEKMPYE